MKIKLTLLSVIVFFTFNFTQAQTVWRGPNTTFSKADNANTALAVNQDRITDTIWITRGSSQGLYNIKTETGYTNNSSPTNTEWALGKAKDWKTLSFSDWENAVLNNPPGSVGKDMCLHLISDSIYIDVKFTAWSQGGTGGGFTYIRSTCPTLDTLNYTVCDSLKSPSRRHIWYQPGTYRDTIFRPKGCDSFLVINLKLVNHRTLKVTACDSFKAPSGKVIWTNSGTYLDTVNGVSSCYSKDSFLTINLTILKARDTRTITVCNQLVSPSGKYTWTASGTYLDTIPQNFCDSIYTIHLTVNKNKFTTFSALACNSYTSPSGNYTWTASGIFSDTLPTSTGCDSVLTINLTINKSQTSAFNQTACNSYISPSGKYIWTTSGTKLDTIPSANGCDSIMTIYLAINNSTSSNVNVSSCGVYTSPSGKYTWANNGTYKDTIKNQQGCDSFMTINLVINSSSAATINVTACKSYLSPSKKYVWLTSSSYKDTIKNSNECDSFLTINLTINNANKNYTRQGNNFIASSATGTFQWMSCNNNIYSPIQNETNALFSAKATGQYALEVKENGCTDTSSCYNHLSLGINSLAFETSVQISPNPNNGTFEITLAKLLESVKMSLFDLNGRLLLHKEYTNANSIIIDSKLPQGIYLIKLSTSNTEGVYRVLVQ